MSLLVVDGIRKREQGDTVLQGITFTLEPLQKIAIAGATGSGKSTLLKIIAGLVQPDEGVVMFDQQKVKGPLEKLIPGHPLIAYLSQYFELRHHYRVREILDMASLVSRTEASRIFELCDIAHLLDRWSHQLSGGESQRIALARLLVTKPGLLLLDEPYSNLDAIHKNELKKVINDVGEQLKMSMILVSHDAADLLSWADEIIVLKEGRIIQKSFPEVIYNQPSSEYAAALFGKYNLLTPVLRQVLKIENSILYLRPEKLTVVKGSSKGLAARVVHSIFMGAHYVIKVELLGEPLIIYSKYPYENDTIIYVSAE